MDIFDDFDPNQPTPFMPPAPHPKTIRPHSAKKPAKQITPKPKQTNTNIKNNKAPPTKPLTTPNATLPTPPEEPTPPPVWIHPDVLQEYNEYFTPRGQIGTDVEEPISFIPTTNTNTTEDYQEHITDPAPVQQPPTEHIQEDFGELPWEEAEKEIDQLSAHPLEETDTELKDEDVNQSPAPLSFPPRPSLPLTGYASDEYLREFERKMRELDDRLHKAYLDISSSSPTRGLLTPSPQPSSSSPSPLPTASYAPPSIATTQRTSPLANTYIAEPEFPPTTEQYLNDDQISSPEPHLDHFSSPQPHLDEDDAHLHDEDHPQLPVDLYALPTTSTYLPLENDQFDLSTLEADDEFQHFLNPTDPPYYQLQPLSVAKHQFQQLYQHTTTQFSSEPTTNQEQHIDTSIYDSNYTNYYTSTTLYDNEDTAEPYPPPSHSPEPYSSKYPVFTFTLESPPRHNLEESHMNSSIFTVSPLSSYSEPTSPTPPPFLRSSSPLSNHSLCLSD